MAMVISFLFFLVMVAAVKVTRPRPSFSSSFIRIVMAERTVESSSAVSPATATFWPSIFRSSTLCPSICSFRTTFSGRFSFTIFSAVPSTVLSAMSTVA